MQRMERRRWLSRLGGCLVALLLGLLARTTRRRSVGWGDGLRAAWQRGDQFLVAFWHETLVLMPFLYTGRRACIMVSRHPDGELIARAIEQFRIDAVRGSSTRGWAGALKGMLQAYRSGSDLAFALDGPQGPPRVAKSGVVQMARTTGASIVPIAPVATWRMRISSWDRLIIPLPGSRIVYAVGEPISVRRGAGRVEIEKARLAVERALNALQAEAYATLHRGGPGPRIARVAGGPV